MKLSMEKINLAGSKDGILQIEVSFIFPPILLLEDLERLIIVLSKTLYQSKSLGDVLYVLIFLYIK